jgi:hypothetical protein
MSAPVKITEAKPLLDDLFSEECGLYSRLHLKGLISLHVAVDQLQLIAERWHLVEVHGQDAIQAKMAFAFDAPSIVADQGQLDEPIPLADEIVRRWELADPRDAWKHKQLRQQYRTPQATIDEFWRVISLNDHSRLIQWLEKHPKDSAYLEKLLEDACQIRS